MNNRALALMASAALLAGPAVAGDHGGKGDWSGAYVGFNLGAGRLEADTTRDLTSTTYFDPLDEAAVELASTATLDDEVFSAGLLAGYNWSMGWGIVGIEGDFNAASSSLSLAATGAYPSDALLSYYATTQIEQDWFATARARFGLELAGSLLYATGGLAAGDVAFTQTFFDTNTATFIGVTNEETRTGWTAGGGIEVPVFGSTTLKVEYLYSDLGSVDLPTTAIPGTGDGFTAGAADLTHQTVRAGMNWRLN